MIRRDLAPVLLDLARHYPVLTLTGPRQSGKTTLCRALWPDKPYVSLEPLDVRSWVIEDPRGFLAEHPDGAVLDEVQNAPDLPGYLQAEVDERPDPGRWVLTGSQHFGLSASVSQSLAGRTAVVHLLPPSLGELRRFPQPIGDLWATLWTGSYPRIRDRGIPADRWLSDYVATYVQRDVRQLLGVGDLSAFTAFTRLAAGRTGQELNLSSLGADAGVSHNTARSWLSVLEASFLCFRAPAWHRNTRKQVIRAPKLHFFDSGIVCHLLGIREPGQLVHHPLRGAIFESWVASEIAKVRTHAGLPLSLSHYRETRGMEVDLVLEDGVVHLVEVKSGATVSAESIGPLGVMAEGLVTAGEHRPVRTWLVFGGQGGGRRGGVELLPWDRLDAVSWAEGARAQGSSPRASRGQDDSC